jgi:protein-tyrosine phosphatase
LAEISSVKKKILFVCLGNICRSPAAEAVFAGIVKKKGNVPEFEIDSAGTSAWHAGERADARMRSHAGKRGYNLTSLARRFRPETDFDHFDLIIAMDDNNLYDLNTMARSEADRKKLRKMTDFSSNRFGYSSVPDPYYGGEDGFELVLDILEDACEALFDKLITKSDQI